MIGITHLVLFKFRNHVSEETIQDVVRRMFDLKNQCIHPETGKPYILSSRGGKDKSVEGRSDNFSYAFVVEFANAEDRDYYTFKEPAHLAFIDSLSGLAEQVLVVDFKDGDV